VDVSEFDYRESASLLTVRDSFSRTFDLCSNLPAAYLKMKKSTIEVVSASLRVLGVSDHHAELERILGVKATASHLKGEKIIDFPWSKHKKWPHDVWVVEAPVEPMRPLQEHLRWVVKKFAKHRAYLHSLATKGAQIDVICSCISEERSVSLVIDPGLLGAVSELGFPLTVRVISVAGLWESTKPRRRT